MKQPLQILRPAAGAMALLCLLLLAGCAFPGGAVSGSTDPEDEEVPAVSSIVTPENLTAEYAPLLAGLWEAPDGGESYLFQEDGAGSVYRTESEELQEFDWSVLSETEGRDLLYLFFDGAEAAVCYLPVFDEGSLTLCDPEDGSALISLLEGTALG